MADLKSKLRASSADSIRQSRREFVRSATVATITGLGIVGTRTLRAHPDSSTAAGVLFEGLPNPPEKTGVYETTLAQLKDGRYWLLFGEKRRLVGKFSSDFGRTWSTTRPVKAVD